MDLRCPICGEPWDLDSFHEVAAEQEITFKQAVDRFYEIGCSAIGWADPCQPESAEVLAEAGESPFGLSPAEASRTLRDLLGDDVDGIASELEDLFG